MLSRLADLESLRSALGAAPTGFVITDFELPDNPIVYANPAFSVMTGYSEAEILGRNCRFLQGPETDRAVVDRLRRCIARGEEFEDELLNYRKNGTTFHNRLLVSPIRDEEGQVRGFVGVQEDATRRVVAEQERERLLADLDDFASIVAHDLQAPLRHIQSYITMIKEEQGELFEGEAARYFETVVRGAERASRMIADTLDVTRSGRAARDDAAVDLDRTIQQVLEDLSTDAAEADARIRVEPLPTVVGHEPELYRLFLNLLSNAIRYRDAQRPCSISVTCETEEDCWRIQVTDNGIGVPEKSYDTVFRAFRRGANVRHSSGSGIGLAVARRIVESHGGRIGLRSELGVGTTFEVTLPRERA